MKKLLPLSFSFLLACAPAPVSVKYKKVTLITASTQTMMVTHTNTTDHRLRNAAGGAVIGYLLGGHTRHAILGGVVGAATADAPKTESYTKMETEVTYHIYFDNGDSTIRTDYCLLHKGDSVPLDSY